MKIMSAMIINKAQGQPLKSVAIYPPSPDFSLWPTLRDISPILVIDSVAVAIIEGNRQSVGNEGLMSSALKFRMNE